MAARLPDFFIVGAPKAGTTSLYEYLYRHPEIFLSPVKEPHYFTTLQPKVPPEDRSRFVRDRTEYARLFAEVDGELAVGEASSSYLWCRDASQRIVEEVGRARIIALLRDPSERAHSHYLMDVRNGTQAQAFYNALISDYAADIKGWHCSHLYVELGMYCSQIARYRNAFGKENVLVLFFDDLIGNPAGTTEQVHRFLGVSTEHIGGSDTGKVHNEHRRTRGGPARWLMAQRGLRRAAGTIMPKRLRGFTRTRLLMRRERHPPMDARSRSFLRGMFDRDGDDLRELMGRNLPWE